jgi:hypothetical protein
MKRKDFSTAVRIVVQLLLGGPAAFLSISILTLVLWEASRRVEPWPERFEDTLTLLPFLGVVALIVSIFATPEFIAVGRRRLILWAGLVLGLLSAALIIVLILAYSDVVTGIFAKHPAARVNTDASRNFLSLCAWLYFPIGPSVVAIWNICRLSRQTPLESAAQPKPAL